MIQKMDNLPVYMVENEENSHRRILHRNLLLPCGAVEKETMHSKPVQPVATNTKRCRQSSSILPLVDAESTSGPDFKEVDLEFTELVTTLPTVDPEFLETNNQQESNIDVAENDQDPPDEAHNQINHKKGTTAPRLTTINPC